MNEYLEPLYLEFCRQVIDDDFGQRGWRLDLSEKIDLGDSWMLGVYLAHELESKQLLGDGRDIAAGDRVIWVTGSVVPAVPGAREVGSVGKLTNKLVQSSELFQQLREKGVELVCLAPEPDVQSLESNWMALCGVDSDWFSLESVKFIKDPAVLRALSTSSQGKSFWMHGRRLLFGATALAMIGGLGLAALSLDREKPSETPRQPPTNLPEKGKKEEIAILKVDQPPRARLLVTTRERQKTCDEANNTEKELELDKNQHFETSPWNRVCSIALELDELTETVFVVMLERLKLTSLVQSGERWVMPVPQDGQWMGRRDYALVVPQNPLDETDLKMLETQLEGLETGALLVPKALEKLLERLNIDAKVYRHKLLTD